MSEEQGESVCNEIGIPFIEVSAKTGSQIEKLFILSIENFSEKEKSRAYREGLTKKKTSEFDLIKINGKNNTQNQQGTCCK